MNERIFWYKFALLAIITVPITCPLCHKGYVNLQNNPTINYPIIGRCSWNKYRKIIYLKENISFLFPENTSLYNIQNYSSMACR